MVLCSIVDCPFSTNQQLLLRKGLSSACASPSVAAEGITTISKCCLECFHATSAELFWERRAISKWLPCKHHCLWMRKGRSLGVQSQLLSTSLAYFHLPRRTVNLPANSLTHSLSLSHPCSFYLRESILVALSVIQCAQFILYLPTAAGICYVASWSCCNFHCHLRVAFVVVPIFCRCEHFTAMSILSPSRIKWHR